MKKLLLLSAKFIFFLLFLITPLLWRGGGGEAFSQQKISGVVTDKNSRNPQGFANVVVKGTTNGTSTDVNGKFELNVDFGTADSVVLQVTYVGYESQELTVSKGVTYAEFKLQPTIVFTKEVVVTASRVAESIMEAPVAIQKITAKQIENAASGDFYGGIGNMQGLDVVTSSFGFKAVNARGFNTTSPFRSVQFIDGMDNQAPGLNFPVGNLVGASDLDLDNVEVITGASSALYGPNAMQGIINMTTKDPYKHPGLDVAVKGGSRDFVNGQFRFARTFGKDDKWGFKLTGDYMSANDWVADDTVANRYGKFCPTCPLQSPDVNLSQIVVQKQYDPTLSTEDHNKFVGVNQFMDFYPVAYPGKINVQAPGYMEKDIVSVGGTPQARSVKTGMGLFYKFNDSLQLSYLFKYGEGSAIYQGTNRYAIKNIRFTQHKLELRGRNFFVKGYTTLENAGDSYDIVFTAINMSKIGITNYVSDYLGEYFNTLGNLTKNSNGDPFKNEPSKWMVDTAHAHAYATSQNSFLKPGTAAFDSAYQKIVTNPNLQTGSKFTDRSSLQHFEGQYNFKQITFADVIAGANYRRYNPQSYGTIFSDTLVNRADTLANGAANLNAKFVDISTYEGGGYSQVTKRVLNNHLKLMGSARWDKNRNYNLQFSPRMSLVYSYNDHHFRVSAQQAFRAPTLQDQYLLLDIGPITLAGNLHGVSNAYTLNSVQEFNRYQKDSINYQSANPGDAGKFDYLLKPITLAAIKPENVKTIEAGYRGVITRGLYVDMTGYYSVYTNFIGSMRVVKLLDGAGTAGQESGADAIRTNSPQTPTYKVYQFPINAASPLPSWGGTAGVYYYFRTFIASANYTYSDIDSSLIRKSTKELDKNIIIGFNTPKNKFNIGLDGNKVYKNFGFSVRYKWSDKFRWQSTFGDGDIKAYSIVDAQVNYQFPEIKSTFRIGASNIFNVQQRQAYGSPYIGRLIFTSWTFSM